MIKDKQYLAAQLNTITKNSKDLSRGYFPYTKVTKKIYNCISIKEISHLRNLFRRNKWDEIIKPKNIAVILRLIVGIDNDAIPICNPQTSNLTSQQRYLIHTLKSLSPNDALNIIRNNQSSIESLFKILDQSLRMMVNLFNKYGSIDDESTGESQDETETQEGTPYMITDKIMDESIVDIPESGSHTTAYSTEDERNS